MLLNKFCKSMILTLLSVAPLASAHPTKLKRYSIGIAGNFSNLADSTSHPYGSAFVRAAQMANEDLKEHLAAAGLVVDIEIFDYGPTADQVIAAAERVVKSSSIAVLGFIYSSHVMMASETFQKNKMLLLTPTATADKIDNLGPYVRRSCFSDSVQGSLLARGALAQGIKTVTIAAAADCAYCLSLKAAFSNEFVENGGKILNDIPVLTADTDYSALYSALKAQPTDAILVPNYETPSALLVSDIIKRGFSPKLWLGGDAWNARGEISTKILKQTSTRALIVAQWEPFTKNALTTSFIDKYYKKFGQNPVDSAALAYDGMTVLLKTLLRDKIRTRQSLVEEVGKLGTVHGVTGDMLFSPDRVTPGKAASLLLIDGDNKTPFKLKN